MTGADDDGDVLLLRPYIACAARNVFMFIRWSRFVSFVWFDTHVVVPGIVTGR
jgi:hypothetical protein